MLTGSFCIGSSMEMLPGRSFPYLPELYEAEGLADVSSLCMPVL